MVNTINNFFLLEYPKDLKPNINTIDNKKMKKLESNINFHEFKIYSDYRQKLNILKNKNKEGEISLIEKKIQNMVTRINGIRYHDFLFIKKKNNASIILNSLNYKNKKEFISFYENKIKLESDDLKKKFMLIHFTTTSNNVFDVLYKMDFCKREETMCNIHLSIILQLFKNLKIGGYYMTSINNYCSLKQFQIIYIMSLIFEKVLIIRGFYILGIGFMGENRISIDKINSLIDKNMEIEPMYNFEKLFDYLNNYIKFEIQLIKYLLDKKFKKYAELSFDSYIDGLIQKDLNYKYMKDLMNNFYQGFKIDKNMNWLEKRMIEEKKPLCKLLTKYIKVHNFDKFLEIGFGLGILGNCILKSNKNSMLISIDEQQEKIWNNYGLKKINSSKNNNNFILYDEETIFALQNIKNKYGNLFFDIILIDKNDSFDKLLLSVYYAKKLVRINGYIFFDKIYSISYFKLIDYIDKNYKDLERLLTVYTDNYIIYKKIDEIDKDAEEFYFF
jgi:hypothetical protein